MALKTNLRGLLNDKFALIFLLLIITLGIFLRLDDFPGVGLNSDDVATIPASMLWFYDGMFPSFGSDGDPPLGLLVLGLGCKLSGEDFSNVTQIQQNFFAGRELLLHEQLVRSHKYCELPVLIFGILFFITVTLFALLVMEIYPALFFISFFAFSPFLLAFSRITKTDVISWVFIALFFITAWLAFNTEKGNKKEKYFFMLSSAFIALAQGVKETAVLFSLIILLIFIDKYRLELRELFKSLYNSLIGKHEKIKFSILYIPLFMLAVFILIFMLPYKFSINTIIEIFKFKFSLDPSLAGGSLLNPALLDSFKNILSLFNIFDTALLLLGIIALIFMLFKKEKTKLERFTLYSLLVAVSAIIIFKAFILQYIFYPHIISIVLLMSLLFSSAHYSLGSLFKRNKNLEKKMLIIVILVYALFSFYLAFASVPYFAIVNPSVCIFSNNCAEQKAALIYGRATDKIADALIPLLSENETFTGTYGILNYYLRHEDAYQYYFFRESVRAQTGRMPTITEKVDYFKPGGRYVRYLLLPTPSKYLDDEEKLFRNTFNPNYIVNIKGQDIVYIYDIKNLSKKS